MDANNEPNRENPRNNTNILSQLTFAWTLPLFWRGARKGLDTTDLIKCLDKDQSETLGNELEA